MKAKWVVVPYFPDDPNYVSPVIFKRCRFRWTAERWAIWANEISRLHWEIDALIQPRSSITNHRPQIPLTKVVEQLRLRQKP